MKIKKLDIAIVGAGPVGLSFALSLANSGLSVAILEKQAYENIRNPNFDGRDIALTHFSKSQLKEWGVWQHLPAEQIHPLKKAQVIDGQLFSRDQKHSDSLKFEGADNLDTPLGFLVANHQIRKALFKQIKQHSHIQLLCEQEVQTIKTSLYSSLIETKSQTLEAKLIVASDSRFSATRRMMGLSAKMKDFGKLMIVCNMQHTLSHMNTAQECFQYERTCAILPLGEGYSSIVLTLNASEADRLLNLTNESFSEEVETMLDSRLGKMSLLGERNAYPLIGVMSNRFIAERFALIGDAAVGMHPVTAHGFNLGLSSVSTLANLIIKADSANKSIASQRLLLEYEARHKLLSKPLYDATNAIVALYTNKTPMAKVIRKLGIKIGNRLPPFQHLVTKRLTRISKL
ncbi:hypothetical protein MED121_22702 [Marinomonas sp. MED121]|uniref:5-demethoxyubiquinol-8 5-hydroxylase UbiM n=1 Tax=Marinomonas sp. MED121 TaxID=314277 RepID=UPI000068FD6C|nr:5-demethoxyubiquinol-8 5-hydroxylase UbiM [Marinomonas sp. MED121]EAQ65530.1 hypothetical protein MED121_22702 [Marinomonas sp. MED121]